MQSSTAGARGFFAPVNTSLLVGRPLAAPFRVDGGAVAQWRRRNSLQSIPHGIEWMQRGHYLANLERAAARRTGGFQGMHWMDSDLYKLLEAIAWDRGGTDDADRFLDETVDLLERAQEPDGYLNSYYQVEAPAERWSDFPFGHEMYLGGHLIQAGVADHRARGGERLLAIGTRFADLLWRRFGPKGEARIDGHPEIEIALVELFRETGDEKYLDLARVMLDRRGHGSLGPGHFGLFYCQDEVPFRQRSELTGHAVRAVYLAIGATDIAMETGDAELLERSRMLWHNTVERKAYLTGGVGSRHFHEALGADYELPPDRAYQETCASIAMAWWSHRLLLATGDDVHAEHLQRTTINAIAAGVSDDGRHFFYRNPLMQRTIEPAPPVDALLEERIDIGTRASWYNTACCPPNLMRFFATLPDLLAYERDGRVIVTLPVEGEVDTVLSTGTRAAVRIPASDPAGGTLTIEAIAGEVDVSRSMLRPARRVRADDGTVVHTWSPGPVLVHPHPRLDAVKSQVAVVFADAVYAVEGTALAHPGDILDVVLDPSSLAVEPDDPASELPRLRAEVVIAAADTDVSVLWDEPLPVRATTRGVTMIPWAQWAAHEPTTMRVWMPAAGRVDHGGEL
ncbi:beta-L-arabinofuranosidase domain-containing protein [Microbacterium sp. 10M-3C3]|uniref:glycoside hydrolase family 127 protein n=1 Tax=Microbacterium sp. 10M-3C3 TaxID=2483401 RepID=UPI0013DD88B8|nr:beta-L-arabinofuranosidase domain-containing protein [Microbacterium sp. 10M-3C3]